MYPMILLLVVTVIAFLFSYKKKASLALAISSLQMMEAYSLICFSHYSLADALFATMGLIFTVIWIIMVKRYIEYYVKITIESKEKKDKTEKKSVRTKKKQKYYDDDEDEEEEE